jgi:hypothetical protein
MNDRRQTADDGPVGETTDPWGALRETEDKWRR